MGATTTSKKRSIRSIKRSLRAIVLVIAIVWLSLVGVVESKVATSISSRKLNNKRYVSKNAIGRGKIVAHSNTDINHTSKRKVPNGSDPIHNRKAGNSRQPPRNS